MTAWQHIVHVAPVSRANANYSRLEVNTAHSGQHLDCTMSEAFFQELERPATGYQLDLIDDWQGQPTGDMIERLEGVMCECGPDAVPVYRDTHSTCTGVLVAARRVVPIAHAAARLCALRCCASEQGDWIIDDHGVGHSTRGVVGYLAAPAGV